MRVKIALCERHTKQKKKKRKKKIAETVRKREGER